MEHITSWEDWTRENCKMSEESGTTSWEDWTRKKLQDV